MQRLTTIGWITLGFSSIVRADDPVQPEMAKDVVLRALVDELERGRTGLKLEDLERPYFIEYTLLDSAAASFSAQLGAITDENEWRSRNLRTEIRVGSYELDNTNFSGGGGFGFDFGGFGGTGMGGGTIPVEDDYNAIRQGIWWATDRRYKSVVETLTQKKAFMQSKMIADKPEDFSHETPTIHFEERTEPRVDAAPLRKLALETAAVFRDFPEILSSSVQVSGSAGNKYLVNSEGTRLRIAGTRFSVNVSATVQSDDGMKLSDSISLPTKSADALPSVSDLSARTRDMAKRLIALKAAPKLDSYTGPVLLEPEAAAQLFSSQFGSRFAGGQRPVGSSSGPEDFDKKLNKRILPKFINIVDDPTQETIGGAAVMGAYEYDDQGVKSRSVNLVEQGRLKALVMSRNPSKEFKQSTGHGRGSFSPRASTACLIVTTTQPTDSAKLRQELLDACQDEDLPYGLRIASLGSAPGGGGGGFGAFGGGGFGGGGGGGGGSTPLEMYKVFPDGHEELVRGAEVPRIDLKSFKRIVAAGDEPYVYNTGGNEGRTVAAPALLFEELDLAKIDRDFDKPPILPTPLARR